MDLYGKLEKLTKLLLQKSGRTVTLDAPDTVAADRTFKLPDVASSGTSTLVDTDTDQSLSNKTLVAPTIASLANMNHTHADAAGGGQLGNSAIASGAAIDRTKLAPGTINHVVINSSGSGALSSEAQLAKSRGGFGMDISSLIPEFVGANVFRVDGSILADQAGIKLYKTIQAAITAAFTAGAAYNNLKLIRVSPGTYTENITIYDGIILATETPTTVKVVGTVVTDAGLSVSTANSGIQGIDFIHTPAASGVSFDLTGAVSTNLCTFSCYPIIDVPVSALHAAPASGQTAIHGLLTVVFAPQVAFTSDVDVFAANGAGALSIYTSSVIAQTDQSAGNICIVDEMGSGPRNYNSVLAYGVLTNAAYSGEVRGFCTESASTGARLAQGCQVRLVGAGSGAAVGFDLDTGSTPSEYYYTGCTAFIDGFITESISYTSTGGVQKIWLNSVNKDLPKSGTGRAIITPYDERKSGFVEWGVVSGGNYWSISSNTFTIVPSGVGIVRGAPVAFAANQSIGLSVGVNYIYVNSLGVIQKSSTGNEALYSDNIVLFQVWYDGTNTRVFKENHPYKFESAISHAWHRLFGVLLEGTGAIISILSGANRTIQSAGADVLTDHGLDTTIADSTGVAVSMTLVYRGAGGAAVIGNTVTQIPGQYNNGTTLSNTGDFVIWRIVVGKDNLEGTAQYFAIADTSTYANLSAANAAITNGTVAAIPTEVSNCEAAMVGYVIINGDNTGAGTLDTVVVARKTFGASFLGGSPSSTANLVSITDIAGPIIDTASTVQAALEEVNTNAMAVSPSGTANALVRFTGTGGQVTGRTTVTCDGAGNFAAVLSINSHAIPSGTGAIVTVDSADTLTNKILTTPTIASFANANHDHSASGANGGLIIAASATQQGAVSISAQTFAGEKTFASGVKVDTIAEKSAGSGVNIDSVLLKDGTVQANSTAANKLPSGTSAQRGSPTAGNIRFNSDLNAVEVGDGNIWVPGTNYKSATLGIGTVSLYTPADSTVVAYEATIYATNLSGSSITKVIAVQAANWEIAVTEAGDSTVTVSIDTTTGELSLTSPSEGAAGARIDVVLYY